MMDQAHYQDTDTFNKVYCWFIDFVTRASDWREQEQEPIVL